MWHVEPTQDYERQRERFERKHPRELQAVLTNLDRLLESLKLGGKLARVKFGFFRAEPRGVYRISEQGGKSLKATRLYVYPHEAGEILYVLALGDKKSQKDDIEYCKAWADRFVQARATKETGPADKG